MFALLLLPLVLACSGNTVFDRQLRPDWALAGRPTVAVSGPGILADRLLVALHAAVPEMPLVDTTRPDILVELCLSEADYIGFSAIRFGDRAPLYSEALIRVDDSADGLARTLDEFAASFARVWRERFLPRKEPGK